MALAETLRIHRSRKRAPRGRGLLSSWSDRRRTGSLIVVALVAATTLPVMSGDVAEASTPPTAALTWAMQDRMTAPTSDTDDYATVQLTGPDGTYFENCCSVAQSQLVPTVLTVKLRGTASPSSAGSAIVSCLFTAPSVAFSVNVTDGSCRTTVDLPRGTSATFTLTVTDNASPPQTAASSVTVLARDLLFVGLGDSYGSGEGIGADFLVKGSLFAYEDTRCHRSDQSSQALTAWAMEQADPHTSVTFIHLACSGAEIENPSRNDGGLLDPYVGVVTSKNPDGTKFRVAAQLDAVVQLLDLDHNGRLDRPIDNLMISIGGNDVGFGDIVTGCAVLTPFTACYNTGSLARDRFDAGVAVLPARLANLRDDLIEKLGMSWRADDPSTAEDETTRLRPDSVFMAEYPVAARDDFGNYCNQLTTLAFNAAFTNFTEAEWKWADTKVAPTLNTMIKSVATGYGWRYVDGVAAPFANHSVCALAKWIVSLNSSLAHQGDKNATFHPTTHGYEVMAGIIAPEVVAHYLHPSPEPTVEFFETATLVNGDSYVNVAGANGWWTGSCHIFEIFAGTCHGPQRSATGYTFRFSTKSLKTPRKDNIVLSVDGVTAVIGGTDSALTCTIAAPNLCEIPPPVLEYIDGAFVLVVDVSVVIQAPGVHVMWAQIRDGHNRTTLSPTRIESVDASPPIVGRAVPKCLLPGLNGWCHNTVTVKLSASDPNPGNGSGLDRIDAVWLGAGPGGVDLDADLSGGTTAYMALEGLRTLQYRAVDWAELMSPLRTATVRIDRYAPYLTVVPDRSPNARGWYRAPVTLQLTAIDGVSGVAAVEATNQDGQGLELTPVDTGVFEYVVGPGDRQRVDGSATDVSGWVSEVVSSPELRVDVQAPALESLTAGDGHFVFTRSELTSGVFTNDTSLSVEFGASDDLSGVHQVRLGGNTVRTESGRFTLELSPGLRTYPLVITDAAGNATTTNIVVVSQVPAAGPATPETAAFWKGAVPGSFTSTKMKAMLASVGAVSGAFGTRYLTPTLANYQALLTPGSSRPPQVRAQLLAAWLNLVSGREAAFETISVGGVSGGSAFMGSATTNAFALIRRCEVVLAGSPTSSQWTVMKNLLTALNAGTLAP